MFPNISKFELFLAIATYFMYPKREMFCLKKLKVPLSGISASKLSRKLKILYSFNPLLKGKLLT
jgi:hypothetical protein